MDWDLKNWADPHTLKRGAAYVQRGAVMRRKVTVPSPGALAIEADVDEGQMPVRVRLHWDGKALSSACSCPMDSPCKHALAVAIAHMADNDKPAEPTAGGGLQAGQEVLFYSLNVAPPPKKLEKCALTPRFEAKTGRIAMIARKRDPGTVTLVRILSMYSSVGLPGRTPGTKPPFFRMFSATSRGLKTIAV